MSSNQSDGNKNSNNQSTPPPISKLRPFNQRYVAGSNSSSFSTTTTSSTLPLQTDTPATATAPTPTTITAEESIPNHQPLTPWRPPSLLTRIIRYNPRLIGWSDDEFRELIDDARRKKRDEQQAIHDENRRRGINVGVIGIDVEGKYDENDLLIDGLMSTLADTAVEYFWKSLSKESSPSSTTSSEEKKKSKFSETKSLLSLQDNEDDIREMGVYKNILNSVKHQRDSYIMGPSFVSFQQQQRDESLTTPLVATTKPTTSTTRNTPNNPTNATATTLSSSSISKLSSSENITPYTNISTTPNIDPTSLANTQLTPIIQHFVPSPTMHNAILPYFLYTITPPMTPPHNLPDGGPIHRIARRALVDVVPLSQPLLDYAVKASVLSFFRDDYYRKWVKGAATGGVVSRMQRDEGGGGSDDENDGGKGGGFGL